MEPESVALLGGLLFLLIAVVGGGFTIREIIMPGVPRWGRLASLGSSLLRVGEVDVEFAGGGERAMPRRLATWLCAGNPRRAQLLVFLVVRARAASAAACS